MHAPVVAKATGDPSPAELAANLRRFRESFGLTQAAFAKVIGVRQQKISEWERGAGWRSVLDAMRLLHVLQSRPKK